MFFRKLIYIVGGTTSTEPPCHAATEAQEGQNLQTEASALSCLYKRQRESDRKQRKDDEEEERKKEEESVCVPVLDNKSRTLKEERMTVII